MVMPYMIPVYALLIQVGSRTIKTIPEPYRVPVAEYLAAKNEG